MGKISTGGPQFEGRGTFWYLFGRSLDWAKASRPLSWSAVMPVRGCWVRICPAMSWGKNPVVQSTQRNTRRSWCKRRPKLFSRVSVKRYDSWGLRVTPVQPGKRRGKSGGQLRPDGNRGFGRTNDCGCFYLHYLPSQVQAMRQEEAHLVGVGWQEMTWEGKGGQDGFRCCCHSHRRWMDVETGAEAQNQAQGHRKAQLQNCCMQRSTSGRDQIH